MTSTFDLLRVALAVPSDDPLQHERLTRSLRDELSRLQGLTVEWVEGAASAPLGAKTGSCYETAFLAIALGRVVVPSFVRVIETWLKSRAEQVLIVEHEGSKFELRGSRNHEDVQLIRKLLERQS